MCPGLGGAIYLLGRLCQSHRVPCPYPLVTLRQLLVAAGWNARWTLRPIVEGLQPDRDVRFIV
ncbi:hypothetical protein BOSEA1005_30386 [Hyphomicrobiales bacterium]|nr:hypothetical protein BOSEA1005_30386 [Hyphomicrobiales bacterium]CAI0346716.1 hypothetical protein BO1005MUT1_520228 [Hyphomicrobiales bacterium]